MSAPEPERLARVGLSRIFEPGDVRPHHQMANLGSAQAALTALLDGGSDNETRAELAARLEAVDPAAELERAAAQGIRFVVPGDEEWPTQVDDLATASTMRERGGPPLGLWVRGPRRLDDLTRSVAVVGSRSATTYGTDVSADLAAGLAREGHTVVSGAAFGIDVAAHRGALAVGDDRTVAVLACGVDRPYPAAHKLILDHLGEHGAVVSEAAPGCSVTRLRFLTRNRIIAALTLGTVVVEAAARSGALNTSNWAGRLNRAVMGVPGPVTSAPSEGVHQLIRSGAAVLVTSAADVLELVDEAGEHLAPVPRGYDHPRDLLSLSHQQVLDAVPVSRGATPTSVARAAGLSVASVEKALDRLQTDGFVERGSEGWRLAARAHT